MKKVLLSVGVLIENDRDCIEKCLQCVEKLRKGMVCELVVGNLGATDGSREVAEKYADQIIDLFWNGSICDAWNTILDHCTGEWYFGIEADECLDACLEPLHNCLKEAESLNAISVAIQEAGAVQWGEVGEQTKREIRVVRLSEQARYEGDVRPTITVNHKNGLVHLTAPLLHRGGTVAKRLEEQKYPYVYQRGENLSMPFTPLYRMLREQIGLPAQIFQTHSEEIDELVSCFQKHEKLRPLWIQWLKKQNLNQSLGMLHFDAQMLFSLLCTQEWGEEQKAQELIARFLSVARQYLTQLYHPKCLRKESTWSMLPTLHHYSWRLVQAMQYMEQGDEYGYLYHLHQAKQAVPMLSGLVDFMIVHPPQKQDTQLQQLARQVRKILSQYAADDPALVAIKSSTAYQKVAHLLWEEGAEWATAVAIQEEPDQSLDADFQLLMEASTFEDQREALEAIVHSYEMLSEAGQDILKEYWDQHPIWGKEIPQMLQKIAHTFQQHRCDFEWLYGRLGDNLSKRVLLAILCNWRFFDVTRLKNVKEKHENGMLHLIVPVQQEMIVDVGAGTGLFHDSYIKCYGNSQIEHYYAYEEREESYKRLEQLMERVPYAKVYQTAVGAKTGVLHREESDGSHELQMVALDDHILGKMTLLKISASGHELDVINGCMNHIKKDAPHVMISLPENFEDIWRLPKTLDELLPDYQFYLRYQGGNLWTSRIYMVAIPGKR